MYCSLAENLNWFPALPWGGIYNCQLQGTLCLWPPQPTAASHNSVLVSRLSEFLLFSFLCVSFPQSEVETAGLWECPWLVSAQAGCGRCWRGNRSNLREKVPAPLSFVGGQGKGVRVREGRQKKPFCFWVRIVVIISFVRWTSGQVINTDVKCCVAASRGVSVCHHYVTPSPLDSVGK